MGGEGHYVITPVDEGLHYQNSLESVLERERGRKRRRWRGIEKEIHTEGRKEGGREGGREGEKQTHICTCKYIHTHANMLILSQLRYTEL